MTGATGSLSGTYVPASYAHGAPRLAYAPHSAHVEGEPLRKRDQFLLLLGAVAVF